MDVKPLLDVKFHFETVPFFLQSHILYVWVFVYFICLLFPGLLFLLLTHALILFLSSSSCLFDGLIGCLALINI